jgi:SAM-dependent methyltransferase
LAYDRRAFVTPAKFLKQSLIFPLAVAAARGRPVRGAIRYLEILRQFQRYRSMTGSRETVRLRDLFPWLVDDVALAGKTDEYFYQDTWCVRHVARHAPKLHVDVGSALISMGCLAQMVPVVYIDLRPADVRLPDFRPLRASLMQLPFADRSLASVSSLSVVEHVGLGRYGDPIDPLGTDRACAELARTLAPAGRLYVAVPTQKEPRVEFNAHRIFAPDEFIAKLPGLSLIDEAYGTAHRLMTRREYDAMQQPYAYGCYCFTR